MVDKIERKIVVPGEVIVKGGNYFPGEGTEKRDNEIVAIRYGLVEESNSTIKIIPLSGVYHPRKGNIVIGKVENITYYGWSIDLDSAAYSFLPLQEVPRYVNQNELNEIFEIGDMVVAKVLNVTLRGVDLTIKSKGLGKIDEGIIIKINSNKIPRIIGKEGSMINLLKKETMCEIIAGQNGFVWIKGNRIEDEILAKKAILFVAERSFSLGLTDELKNWIEREKRK